MSRQPSLSLGSLLDKLCIEVTMRCHIDLETTLADIKRCIKGLTSDELAALLSEKSVFSRSNRFYNLVEASIWAFEGVNIDSATIIAAQTESILEKISSDQLAALLSEEAIREALPLVGTAVFFRLMTGLAWFIREKNIAAVKAIAAQIECISKKISSDQLAALLSESPTGSVMYDGRLNRFYSLMRELNWAAERNIVDAVKVITRQIEWIVKKVNADQLTALLSQKDREGVSAFHGLLNELNWAVERNNIHVAKVIADLIVTVWIKSTDYSLEVSEQELLHKHKDRLRPGIIKHLESIENPDEITRITDPGTSLGKLIDHQQSLFKRDTTDMRKKVQEIIDQKKQFLAQRTAQDAASRFMNHEAAMIQEDINLLASTLINARENGYDISSDPAFNFNLLSDAIRAVRARLNVSGTDAVDNNDAQTVHPEGEVDLTAQPEPVFLGTVVEDPRIALQSKLASAMEKLKDGRFDFLGADKRKQKRAVLGAAQAVIDSNASDIAITVFVRALEQNPDYAHTFQPGKESVTLALVRECIAFYPEIQSRLVSRCHALEEQRNALELQRAGRRSVTLFERLGRVSDVDQLAALRSLIVHDAQLPSVVTGVVIESASADCGCIAVPAH